MVGVGLAVPACGPGADRSDGELAAGLHHDRGDHQWGPRAPRRGPAQLAHGAAHGALDSRSDAVGRCRADHAGAAEPAYRLAVARRPVRLMVALHSRLGRALVHPAVRIGAFVVSLHGLYFSPLLDILMATHAGHQFMLVHFLVSGSVLLFALLAVDPTSYRNRPGVRPLLLALTLPVHAVFGVIVMGSPMPLSAHFGAASTAPRTRPGHGSARRGRFRLGLRRDSCPRSHEDHLRAVATAGPARGGRQDRRADRNGDAELAAYNERLAEAARHAMRARLQRPS